MVKERELAAYQNLEDELNAFELEDQRLSQALMGIEKAAPVSQREIEYLESMDQE